MDEIPKLGIDTQTTDTKKPVAMTKTRRPSIRLSKKALFILPIFLALFVILFFVILFPAQKVYRSALLTKASAEKVWAAIKKQNVEVASVEIKQTKKDLAKTSEDLKGLAFVKFIPIVSGYYNDADHLVKAGTQGIEAADVLLNSVKPYADVLGLKGQGSFVMGSAEQRIQTAVSTMGKITPRIDDISGYLTQAKKELDQVDPNHYYPFLGLGKIQKQLIDAKAVADVGVSFVEEARPLIKVLPTLLGESKEKKYLVIFQNDKELRPTGGFMTAYAVFRIDKGVIHVDRSDDIYTLDASIARKDKAPEPILKYLPKVPLFNLRDSNLSPDFVESMKTFRSLYDRASGKVTIDGIVALDTHVLVSVIKILDDEVIAGGVRFTTKIDKRCDCPQVIYELESMTDTPRSLDLRITSLASAQAHRKDIIGLLLYAVMQKALKSSPKLYWGPLVQAFIKDTNEKHVLFSLNDVNAQRGIEALSAAGRIKPYEGDYLHINDANMGGAKANLFTRQAVTQDIKIAGDGSIEKTVTVSYKNSYPPSDCNLERGGLCLNAQLRDWVRVYVPKGSILKTSKGSEIKVTTSTDLGKTVFEGFLTIRPQGQATYTLTYTLPFKLTNNSLLPLLIQKQPGTDDNEYIVKVAGRQIAKFPLLTDKELKITR